jgi:membrane protein YdbS with pleckstrin-like domain
MTYIPDPFYNKVIQLIMYFFVVSLIIGIGLGWLGYLTDDLAAHISVWMVVLFILVCIYDKWKQHKYWKYIKENKNK